MAKIPMNFDPKSTRKREVTVVVYVDGKEHMQATYPVEEWAVPHVSHAALAQLEDPDYEGAAEAQAAAADRAIGGTGP